MSLLTPRPIRFGISRIEAWAPGVTTADQWQEWAAGTREIGVEGEPSLSQMAPMLRRHAGRLGRLACSVAYDVLDDTSVSPPVVFSSRYGEVNRSVDLLTSLVQQQELSPANFGMSVHNAVPGLFSMARKDTANSIAIAGGDESAEYGVLESCSLLADGAPEVLLVVADCPLPDVYAQFGDTASHAFGWAALLSTRVPSVFTLSWDDVDVSTVAPATLPEPGALEVLTVLQGNRPHLTRTVGPRQWQWLRHG